MLFAVTPTNDSSEPMTVTYTTVEGVEAREGVDYVPVTGTVVFPPETLDPQIIRVPVVGDRRHERTQKFLVRLVGALEAVLDGIDGVGEIEDDDPVPTVSISDVSVGEANSGTVKAALRVTLSNETNELVTVRYSTADNSAVGGEDFAAASGVLTFDPGTTNQVVTIDVTPAVGIEGIETFYVELMDAAGATLEKSRGVVTITPPEAWVTSTVAEFSLGALGAGGYLAETSGGEITLAPTVGTEFSGSALPAGWTNTVVAEGGTTAVTGGSVSVDGTSVLSPTIYSSGHTLEFAATFSGQPNQNVGFGLQTALLPPFAMFGVKADGKFYARSVGPSQVFETLMPGNWFNTPHRFRIDWKATSVVFWIDGTQRAVHNITYKGATGSMRPAITDLTAGDGALSVDWIRMTAYAASGSYTSPVFDAGVDVVWQNAAWIADLPAGTSVVVEVRTGTTAAPAAGDPSWTAFTPVVSGARVEGVSRYAQYRVTLATTVPASAPALKEVTVTFLK
jgi:Calx-beta domain